MGRPKKIEPRDRQLNLCLTDSEFERIRRRAEAVGMRLPHFARLQLLDESRKLVRSEDDRSNPTRLLYLQLSRLGNNLNQLVRQLHRSGHVVPSDLDSLLADIRTLIAKGWQK